MKILLSLLVSVSVYANSNWPAWRGPTGDGISTTTNLPVRWDKTNNVRWRVDLSEPGNSTPIHWNNQIFLTQSLKEENQRLLISFDGRDGKELWRSGVKVANVERTHNTNPHASASPVTDGERVVCWFGSGGLVAYDLKGRELWRADLGEHNHQFGYGGSPVIAGDVVVLNFGPGPREFLVAVDKKTGKERWRHTSKTPGADDIMGTWSTPFVTKVEGKTQIISALRNDFAALNPETGAIIWSTPALGGQAKTSPIAGEGVALISGDMQSAEVAVKLGATGEIADSDLLWKKNPVKRRIGTGVIHNGRYFGVQTIGIADCIHLRSGESIWEERLTGSGSNSAVWSSPILAGDKLYVMNQAGDVFVWRAADSFERLALNSLNEPTNSSVVPMGDQLLLRTHKALWCIGPTLTGNR